MEIKGKVHCLFEQSGTFKNEFKKLGFEYWVTDYVDANELRVDAIEEVCKKILDEVRAHEGIEQMTKFYIGEIIEKLGVRYDR